SVGLSAFPSETGTTKLGVDWLRAPLMGIASSLGGTLARWGEHILSRRAGRAAPRLGRPHHARVRRADRRADPHRRGDDVDLRLRPARVLARGARTAASPLPAAAPAR